MAEQKKPNIELSLTTEETRRWIDQLKAFDDQAWHDVVTCFASVLEQDVIISLRKRDISLEYVEDIQQETWRIAVQHIGEFNADDMNKLYNWIRVIALNNIRMLKRKLKVEIPLEEFSDSFDEAISLDRFVQVDNADGKNPEHIAIIRERLAILSTALQELSTRDQEILLRYTINDEKPRDLAKDYGIKVQSISQVLYRSKQIIGKYVQVLEEGY